MFALVHSCEACLAHCGVTHACSAGVFRCARTTRPPAKSIATVSTVKSMPEDSRAFKVMITRKASNSASSHAGHGPRVVLVVQRLLGSNFEWIEQTLLKQVKHHTKRGVLAVVVYAQDNILAKLLRSQRLLQQIQAHRLFVVRYEKPLSKC